MLSQLLIMFAVTFTVFILFFIFMNIGYMVKKQPLKGSCGGVANLMGDENCQFCGDDPNKCAEISAETSTEQQDNGSSKKASQLGKSVL